MCTTVNGVLTPSNVFVLRNRHHEPFLTRGGFLAPSAGMTRLELGGEVGGGKLESFCFSWLLLGPSLSTVLVLTVLASCELVR